MHPDGFHKTDEARARCWGCGHLEMLEPSDEDRAEARRLLEDGWVSTSNRHRRVSRVDLPPFEHVVFTAELPAWAADAMRRYYEGLGRDLGPRVRGEHLELDPRVFRAFKLLERGGR